MRRSALFVLAGLAAAGNQQLLAQKSTAANPRPQFSAAPVTAVAASAPAEKLSVRLSGAFSMAPGTLSSLVRVPRHTDNRSLRISIESAAYYRRSDVQLDGAAAPMTHQFFFQGLPSGSYDMTVTVMGAAGPRSTSQHNFVVLGTSLEK
jgi:hypothetical protein